MTAGQSKHLLALSAALGLSLLLAGCSSFSGFVADSWPTWAGGMPKDVPPRPGAPGYEEFIAHQQQHEPSTGTAAGAAPGSTAVVVPAGTPAGTGAPVQAQGTMPVAAPASARRTTAAVPPPAYPPPTSAPASNAAMQPPLPPAYARPDDSSATRGGLY